MQKLHNDYTLQFIALIIALIGLPACIEDAPYYYAEKITERSFQLYHEDVGIYPNTIVLQDPNNPFAKFTIGRDTRWQIQSSGDSVAAFYAWASILTKEVTGEHQFYVALNLQNIYESRNASEEDLPYIRDLAIRGFQNVLDYFPKSVTFDRSGKIAYALATSAYQAIIELGAVPKGGWSLLSDADGNVSAVQTSNPPRVEDE